MTSHSSASDMADPTADLVPRAKRGDAAALDALVRWCYPRVQRWALMRTSDRDEADDVTQDVMSTLGARLASFRGESSFSTWLFRLTANVDLSARRRHARRSGMLARWWHAEEAPDEEQRRLSAIHGERIRELVRLLMQELPAQQRMVFDLADLQETDTSRIAEMMALEPATVRSHLMRARRTMRERMLQQLPSLNEERT